MTWTKDEEHLCLQMIRQGKNYAEIATALGREKNSVASFVKHKRQRDPSIWKKIAKASATTHQKCETCYYASGAVKNGFKCPWADRLEPVPGWDATPTIKNNQISYSESFEIRDCPHYEEG